MASDGTERYKTKYALVLKETMTNVYNSSSVPTHEDVHNFSRLFTDEDVYNSIKGKILFDVDLEVVQKLIKEHMPEVCI